VNIRTYLIFLETRIIGLHFAADGIHLSSLKIFTDFGRKLGIESAYATSY